MPVEPAISTSLVAVLIIAVTALAGTVAYLWKYYSGRAAIASKETLFREAEHSKERAAWSEERTLWAAERVEIKGFAQAFRAEYEEKMRALSDKYAESVRALSEKYTETLSETYDNTREQENVARREYLANMEVVAEKAQEAQSKIGAVLDKALERSLGARSRGTKD